MNITESQPAVELTVPEQRFVEAEHALFRECDVEVRQRFLHAGDRARRISVLETGAGAPLVMIHGGNSVAATWAPLWARLRGFRVIAPDRPGCGLTHRQDYRGVDFRRHAVEFVREVMDGAGVERASLVANSMGGFWALLFGLAHPERVERIVLVGEPAGSTRVPSGRHRLGGLPLVNRLVFATVARPAPDGRMLRGLMADPARASAPLVACAYAGSQIPGAGLAWRTMLERVAMPPWRPPQLTLALAPELRSLRPPVLFAWGDRDFAPVAAGREIARHVPNSRFEVVSDAGHLAWLDQPDVVAGLVDSFLRP